jgi:hypothetical protein
MQRALAASMQPFGPAYTWCDGACSSCLLEPRCALARALRGAQWLDELAAEPAGGWDAVVAHVDHTPVELPATAFAERLRRAGADYSSAVSELLGPLPQHDQRAPSQRAGAQVGIKVRRLASMLALEEPPRFEPAQAWSAFANVMLIERLDRVCSQGLCVSRPPLPLRRFTLARGRLWAMLLKLRRKVPSSARRALFRLITTGNAPSPFSISTEKASARRAGNG